MDPNRERDILAERRARRSEPGDSALLCRAEVAEATVRTLETHLAELQRRAQDAARERQETLTALAEVEQEVRRVKQREYAEQQLRVEAEDRREQSQRERRAEIDGLQRRLSASDRHVRQLTDQLESVRRELAEAEQAAAAERVAIVRTERELAEREADLSMRELALDRTRTEVEERLKITRASERQATIVQERAEQRSQALATRLQTLEQRVVDVQREADSERVARQRSELRLKLARDAYLRMEQIVRELMRVAVELRGALARERTSPAEPAPQPAKALEPPPTTPLPPTPPPTPDGAEMAQALAAAVERLRARVAAVSELQVEQQTVAQQAQSPRADVTAEPSRSFHPRLLSTPEQSQPWLAAAIRAVAEHRDAKLAGELILELLPAQRLLVDRPTRYGATIAEFGSFRVELDAERAVVERVSALTRDDRLDFILEGPAAAFSELAAGGTGRRLPGLRIRAGRRRVRRLRSARRTPVGLAELAGAQIRVWPGLLLLALAEAIDPAWTVGHRFVIAFAITGEPEAVLHVRVRDGESIVVTRERSEHPLATVQLSEAAFLCLLAGLSLPAGEQVLLSGNSAALELLIGWADRAQGPRPV
jgi:hypothetical protein